MGDRGGRVKSNLGAQVAGARAAGVRAVGVGHATHTNSSHCHASMGGWGGVVLW